MAKPLTEHEQSEVARLCRWIQHRLDDPPDDDALHCSLEGGEVRLLARHIAALEECTHCTGEMVVEARHAVPGVEQCAPCPVCNGTGKRVPDAEIIRLRRDAGDLEAALWYHEEQRKEIAAQAEQILALRSALEEIADPIARIRRTAEAEGKVVNGYASLLAESASDLRDTARKALAALPTPTKEG